MLTFTKFLLQEHFHNLIGNHPDKEKHKQEVFDMVQKAYEPIGGIHGSGFKNPDDMAKNIPFWKIKKKGGKVKAAVFYKDKGGRKSVACATDGTPEGKKHLATIMHDDIMRGRSYGEKSGKALSFLKKQLPENHLQKMALHHDEVKRLMPDDEIDTNVPHDDPELVAHPELKDHFYRRKIGDEWHTKISLGTPGNKIES